MQRCLRKLLGLLAAACVIGALAWPSFRASLMARRECYRIAEFVGIMNPTGDLGGQVAGFNYQRHPRWVHPVAEFIAGAAAFTPALVLSLLVLHRVGFGTLGWRATLCGKCGSRMRGLTEPRCARCGAEF